MTYVIEWTAEPPAGQGQWDDFVWRWVKPIQVDQFHPQSSVHRPVTQAKVLYDDDHLYVIFRVQDQYVRAVYTEYQDPVYNDSCVEFFVMPAPSTRSGQSGYFNFEMNCIGTLLVYFIEDSTRSGAGFKKYTPLPADLVYDLMIFHSWPGQTSTEIFEPVEWTVEYRIPFVLFEAYLGPVECRSGAQWHGNFYKCGDRSSHPHWASWAPIGEALNFHQPQLFGRLQFDAFRRTT